MIYLGIDCGATTSKVGGVDASGELLSQDLRQAWTRGSDGPEAMITGWIEGAEGFLRDLGHSWEAVDGVGLGIPGPYLDYGVLGPQPNLPRALEGWNFLEDLRAAVSLAAGRIIPVVTANDGQLAGLAEARFLQAEEAGGVLLLAPGSGLGCSFIQPDGTLLEGDHRAATILAHLPCPHQRLGLPAFRCGCGRDWGCFETYTSLSGLPQLLAHVLPEFPNHEFACSDEDGRTRVLSLRDRAQEDDPLARRIFDIQAQAMGLAVATGAMAYDPTHIVIGGGLMDPDATSSAFRKRYLEQIQASAKDYAWVPIEQLRFHPAALGELSQAIGAALLAASRLGSDAFPGLS